MSERIVTVGGPDPTRPLSEFDRTIAGTDFYVGPNATGVGDDGRSGRSKESSMATLEAALALVTASKGDTIYLLPGHAEIIITAIDVNKIGVNIVGLGNGDLVPTITCNAAIDCMDITVADVRIRNVHFPVSTLTGVTSRINVGATNCVIEDCLFDCGEFDTETITVEAAGDDLTVKDCRFVCDSAATADAAIEVENLGVDGLHVIDCHFDGYDDTQAWDTGAINSGVAHTRCLIKGNTTLYGPGIIFSDAATGMIVGNYCTEGTIGGMIDPGSCMCIENYESDAVDETGSLFPQATPHGTGAATELAAILADTVAIGAETTAILADTVAAPWRCCEKSDGTVEAGTDAIFDISGGPVRARIVGVVTGAALGGNAANGKLQIAVTTPSADIELNAGAVAMASDAEGTVYTNINATSVFTPTSGGASIVDNVAANEALFILPIGTVKFHSTAANTGNIKWYMTYQQMSPSSVVGAAA